jgi:hypothetical protein
MAHRYLSRESAGQIAALMSLSLRQRIAPAVIASEAKQSILRQQAKYGLLRRFAPRNDGEPQFHDLAA